jgi:transposase
VEAIAEAVQRPTMSDVAVKPLEQMDLLALHRVRSRLIHQRTGITNQIRNLLLERGITMRQRLGPSRKSLQEILGSYSDALSPQMVSLISDLAEDWLRPDERIAHVSAEIEARAAQDEHCQRLMSVPDVGPIISSALVTAIRTGARVSQGRDLRAWLSLVPKQEPTGDRTILGKISKRGSKYLRTLFMQATHIELVCWPHGKTAASQHAGDRANRQARSHHWGNAGPRAWLSAQECLRRCEANLLVSLSGTGSHKPMILRV